MKIRFPPAIYIYISKFKNDGSEMDITINSIHSIVQYTFSCFLLIYISIYLRKIRGFCFHNFSSTVLIRVQAHAQLGNCSTLQSWGRVHYARSTLRLFWLEGSLFASVKLSYRCSHLDYKEYLGLSPLRCKRLTMENSLGTSSDQ